MNSMSSSLDTILFSQTPAGYWSWDNFHSFLATFLGQSAADTRRNLEQTMIELSMILLLRWCCCSCASPTARRPGI